MLGQLASARGATLTASLEVRFITAFERMSRSCRRSTWEKSDDVRWLLPLELNCTSMQAMSCRRATPVVKPGLFMSLKALIGSELSIKLTVMKTLATAPGEDDEVIVDEGERTAEADWEPPVLKLMVHESVGITLSLNVNPK
jgi:hypothetical protein